MFWSVEGPQMRLKPRPSQYIPKWNRWRSGYLAGLMEPSKPTINLLDFFFLDSSISSRRNDRIHRRFKNSSDPQLVPMPDLGGQAKLDIDSIRKRPIILFAETTYDRLKSQLGLLSKLG